MKVTAQLSKSQVICYRTHIPDLEAAVVLKAHAWHGRKSPKDLADLYSLLEVRAEHQSPPWNLNVTPPKGRRLDTARILRPLAETINKRNPGFEIPGSVDRVRLAALINAHIAALPKNQ